MSTPSLYSEGTITLTQGSAAFTGTGTAWSTRLKAGSFIIVDGLAGVVASVEGDTAGTLSAEWAGDSVSGAEYESVTWNSGAEMAAGLRDLLEQLLGKGLFKVVAGAPVAGDHRDSEFVLDRLTGALYVKDQGVMRSVTLPIGNGAGAWEGPGGRFALSISTGDVDVDFEDGLNIDGVAYFVLDFDASFELQHFTNVEVGSVIDILFRADGGGDTPSYPSGFEGDASDIRNEDKRRARVRYTVDAETGGTSTAVTAEMFAFTGGQLVSDGGANFLCNGDAETENTLDPLFDGSTPLSENGWTYIAGGAAGANGEPGAPGSAVVTGTSSSSVSIGTGSKSFTIAETSPQRGWAVGARLRIASNANPTTHWMSGLVTSFDGTTLGVTVDQVLGSGSRSDWRISLSGERGAQGGTGSTGAAGTDGTNAFLYVAYASSDAGAGFSLSPSPSLDYVAFKQTATEIETPSAGDFSGLWKLYRGPKGDKGDKGDEGDPGEAGASGGQWFSGSADPDNGDGENGDFYLQTGTGSTGNLGDIWAKDSGSWSIITNIKGSDGEGAGSVTSVQVAVPTGFAVSGGPITSSGTITISFDTGYQGYTSTEASKLSGIETGADVTDAGNVGSVINAASGKTTPADADTLPITDTAASNVIKKVTFTNLKAFLKTYFDTVYQPLAAILTAIAALSSTGLVARTGSGTVAVRTITGTSNQVTVSNGDGVSGNPTLSLPQNIHTGASPQFTGLNLGHASDTTFTRVSAGVAAIEGNNILTANLIDTDESLTANSDALIPSQQAVKAYVDANSGGGGGGGTSYATSVRCATTSGVTISTALNAGDSIDGVTLQNGDRVLVWLQGTASQNGVYVVGDTPARASEYPDADSLAGVLVTVQEGSNRDITFIGTHNKGATDIEFWHQRFAQIEMGTNGALDTTITRAAAGVIAVEGVSLHPGIPIQDKSANYTLVNGDAQTCIRHPASDANNRTFTIPANASVAYPVGTCITFLNEANTVTIAINSDTLVFAGSGGTGSRSLAAHGWATATKVASDRWYISGVGLT